MSLQILYYMKSVWNSEVFPFLDTLKVVYSSAVWFCNLSKTILLINVVKYDIYNSNIGMKYKNNVHLCKVRYQKPWIKFLSLNLIVAVSNSFKTFKKCTNISWYKNRNYICFFYILMSICQIMMCDSMWTLPTFFLNCNIAFSIT